MLGFMVTLPNISRPIIQQAFRQNMTIQQKADTSPVTATDKAVEAALGDAIHSHFPDHAIKGEESYDGGDKHSPYVWVIDPIDGTRAFAVGNPMFGTLIGLTLAGKPYLGLIDLPVLQQCWLGGIEAMPTRMNDTPVATAAITDLSQARLASTSAAFLGDNGMTRFAPLAAACGVISYGGDCANYAFLASGWCDLVAEAKLAAHDIMGVVPVVEAAGGIITQWDGKPIRLGEFDGTVLAAANEKLHSQALAMLQK